ncbi:hypothetical protein HJD18_13225 [Thermoleophilia bacterium SCSIO 60948]|nr:hypothetical protein HJD18_13225 [Thermoleophilia bacterium SCSIO 60948]
MIAYLVSAALVVGASFVVGGAVQVLCGRRASDPLSGAVGLAALLVAAGLVRDIGGGEAFIAVVLIGLVLTAATTVVALGPAPARERAAALPLGPGVLTGALAFFAAAVPFIAAGAVGILGVGLVNDDMASHLLLADWIREGFEPEPVLVGQGYPLGPHALVAAIAWLLDASTVKVFAGFNSSLTVLLAIGAFGLLRGLPTPARVVASVLVSVPYLAAAYLAQEAFKEPAMGLFVLAFAVAVARPLSEGQAAAGRYVPAAVIAGGTLFVYSFPGLVWLGLTAAVWIAISVVGGVRAGREIGSQVRAAALPVGLAAGVFAALVLADVGRLIDFADFRALDPDRANEGGLGNLRGHISPLEAFGVWPSGEFRLAAGASGLPALVFYAGGLLGLAAFGLGLARWTRRHGPALLAALAAAAVVYLAARGLGTVYTSAKALAVAAPTIALVTFGGLLTPRDGRSGEGSGAAAGRRAPLALALLAALYALAAAGSTLLVLRQAPVGPTTHADELAQIRPVVQGQRLLFLGRDNFVLWELRGSEPYTHVRNYYDPYFVEPNFDIEQVGSKFDFDSVDARTLARFPFVLTTRASYASGPPPGYRPEVVTDSYVLWRAGESPGERRPAEVGPEPGAEVGCESPLRLEGETGNRIATVFAERPVLAPASSWSPDAEPRSGSASTIEIELGAGSWDLSLAYDATRPLTLSAPGFEQTIPANLDYRGVSPYWPAGRIVLDEPATVTITADVADPPLAGRLLGAESVAHLGALAATRTGEVDDPLVAPGPGAASQAETPGDLCSRGGSEYVDWTAPLSATPQVLGSGR